MHPELVVQLIINGVLLGGVFALAALGLNIIFGVTRIVNLAHGQLIILTALICSVLFQKDNITPLEVLPFAMVGGIIVGAGMDRVLLRRLPHHAQVAETTSLLIMFGASYFQLGHSLAIFTGDFRSVAYMTGSWSVAH
ncbi:MAG: ABC transporter permease subunit, partial [Vulcanimicrobiaceae bacterium]